MGWDNNLSEFSYPMGPLGSTGFLINIQLISNSSQQGNEDLSDGETISQLYGNMHLSSHNSTTIIIQIHATSIPNRTYV